MQPDLRQGWYPDPTGRHAERWYVGGRASGRVRDRRGGGESMDRLTGCDARLAEERASVKEGWFIDPTGRHEQRWFSAGWPTDLIRDGTHEGRDPLDLATLDRAATSNAIPAPHGHLPETDPAASDVRTPVPWWDRAGPPTAPDAWRLGFPAYSTYRDIPMGNDGRRTTGFALLCGLGCLVVGILGGSVLVDVIGSLVTALGAAWLAQGVASVRQANRIGRRDRIRPDPGGGAGPAAR